MPLVFLHGPPASGKLTVARELATLTGFRLFHNHLVVDVLTAVFEFGTAPFIRLREQLWGEVLREAVQQDRSVIFTFAPERTVSAAFMPRTMAVVHAAGGRVDFVALICPLEELERRFEKASRATFGKLRSRTLFHELRQTGTFDYPPLPDSGLSIDTSQCRPQEAALRTCAFFSLPRQSAEEGSALGETAHARCSTVSRSRPKQCFSPCFPGAEKGASRGANRGVFCAFSGLLTGSVLPPAKTRT